MWQSDSAAELSQSCCVCVGLYHLRISDSRVGGGRLIADLCVGEVRPVRYLRGDTGAPAHALLAAPC